MSRLLSLCLLCSLACLVAPPAARSDEGFSPEQLEFFEKQVRPILVSRCYECHSGKTEEPKGNLRVDSREFLLKGGDTEPAIVPGDAKKSLLVDAINYGETYQMPPKTKLPAAEIAILTKWVDQGAPWPASDKPSSSSAAKAFDLAARKADHWCWQPLANPAVPAVKNVAWPADDLDRFILAKLEENGFTPAGPAEKRTLLRRVYFDLIGLPPTPEQVTAFLADGSPEALAKVVDELLKSPHFGERWGRHWLDLVRYAESRGHEFDPNAPNAYQYRDYVIRALNSDVPYDQFVIEHVAGDLIEKPRTNPEKQFNESILGTGFWFLGEWVHSPVDIRKDEADRYDNMLDVFSKTFLGLTVACARCHDHKFDAISQADYYALSGYLQSSSYRLVRFDTMLQEERIARELDELNRRFEPEVRKAIAQSQAESVSQVGEYLVASRHIIQSNLRGSALVGFAKEKKLDFARLEKWVAYLEKAEKDSSAGFHLWARLCREEGEGRKLIADTEKAIQAEQENRFGETKRRSHQEIALFVQLVPPAPPRDLVPMPAILQWLLEPRNLRPAPTDSSPQTEFAVKPNGVSFGVRPVEIGDVLFGDDPEKPVLGFAELPGVRREPAFTKLRGAAGVERDPGKLGNFDRAGKTVRTATFELDHGMVHYLVKGRGHAYAAVDSHAVVQGPLHGQLAVDFDKGEGELRWITQDLRAYQKRKAHIEFSPAGDADLQIISVVQGEKPKEPLLRSDDVIEFYVGFDLFRPKRTLREVAERYQEAFTDEELVRYTYNWLWSHPDLVPRDESKTREIFAKYAAERKKITDQIQPESRYAMAMWDGTSEDEVLMIRGNPHITGQPVPRRMLTALSGEPAQVEPGSGRLALARELVDPNKNPLVPRVMVNRMWHHLLGRGLSTSVDNFGVLGAEPTHPELLDHLAARFVRDGWSLKRLIRTIVLSRTYQMASTITDVKAEEADPKNLLWRRTNLRRLQAETIRDQLLALSGRLDRTMYGPSVPTHLTPFMQGRGRPGTDGPLDGHGRRSIYLSVRRNFLSPMMLAFDAPIPFSTMGSRNVSNVPAQALILMNDPLVVQQAELWAKRELAAPDRTPEQRIAAMYEAAYARPASGEETAAALAFLASQAKEYGLSGESSASDVRVWTDLAHVLMNSKEFIFLD